MNFFCFLKLIFGVLRVRKYICYLMNIINNAQGALFHVFKLFHLYKRKLLFCVPSITITRRKRIAAPLSKGFLNNSQATKRNKQIMFLNIYFYFKGYLSQDFECFNTN